MGCNSSKPGRSVNVSVLSKLGPMVFHCTSISFCCSAAPKPPGEVRGLEQHPPQQAVAAVPRVKLVLLGDSVRLLRCLTLAAQPVLYMVAGLL